MKEFLEVFRTKWKFLWKTFFFYCYIPSLVCFCFVELCSRKSVVDLFLFLIREPLVFFYNVLIIAATASVCLLFKRRIFVLSVVLLLWTAIGVTDFVLLSFRTTPFTAVDLALIKDALAIANRYLSWIGVVLIILGVFLVLILCVLLFRKAKKMDSVGYKIGIPFCGLLILLCLALTEFGMSVGLLDRNFGNLARAFHENGLPYCFMNSVLNTGIEKPDGYSEETVGNFLNKYEEEEGRELVTISPSPSVVPVTVPPSPAVTEVPQITKEPEQTVSPVPTETQAPVQTPTPEVTDIPVSAEDTPNIIFLQLESFFDVKNIENFSASEDPIPFFTFLKETYPSGFLEVPSIGAGTANTEFECITGMNLDFFGPGEYPYKTLLKNNTCESMAYILKHLGYSATAMHNNDGTFYNRNNVFANLGFDRYVSIEYMAKAEVNELNWARDRVLVGQIMKTLAKTKERDYIYAISVQGHGAYPEEPILPETTLEIHLPEELGEYYYQYLYYVHQLKEMDDFLKELVLNLSSCQEKIVLVLYGDHLPSLGLSDELLTNQNVFQTEYVVWSNFGLIAEDMDVQSYQLPARILHLLGIEEGIMPQYHIYRRDEEDYLENMQLLMYDMLYGDREVFEGENPYEPADMQMGLEEIHISEVFVRESLLTEGEQLLYVAGQNFTEWSKVYINMEEVETIFLTDRLLAARNLPESKTGGYYIKVAQQGADDIILSETEAIEFYPE